MTQFQSIRLITTEPSDLSVVLALTVVHTATNKTTTYTLTKRNGKISFRFVFYKKVSIFVESLVNNADTGTKVVTKHTV